MKAEPTERIESRILLVRGQKAMLDADLAQLYGVSTKRFNEQVRRNGRRFPPGFMFQLTIQEVANLRSQFATSRVSGNWKNWGGRATCPITPPEPKPRRRIGFLSGD